MEDLGIKLVKSYPVIYEIYLSMRENDWTEVKLKNAIREDKPKIVLLKFDEKQVLKKIVTIFNGLDSIISKYLSKEFINHFDHPEIQCAFGLQNNQEIIHQITYNEYANVYFEGEELKEIRQDQSPQIFIDWVKKYIPGNKYINLSPKKKAALLGLVKKEKLIQTKDDLMAKEILASCLIEGVFIPTFFAQIFWFKDQGLLDGFTKGNEYIEIDEDWHLTLAIVVYNILSCKIEESYFHEMIRSFYLVIQDYCKYLKELNCPGLSFNGLMLFTEHRFDLVLERLGYNKLFNSVHHLEYMRTREIKLRSTLFFTSYSTEYNQPNFDADDQELDFDEC